jgi:hypothetical protein
MVVLLKKMLTKSNPISTQSNLFHSELFSQLDVKDPLIVEHNTRPCWHKVEFSLYFSLYMIVLYNPRGPTPLLYFFWLF